MVVVALKGSAIPHEACGDSTRAKYLASEGAPPQHWYVDSNSKRHNDLAARIYRQLAGVRGLDDTERWQHALFFAMLPQERCRFSLKTARSALSLRRSARKK